MIEAQEMLKQMSVASYPHMTKDQRGKLHKKLHKDAYPRTHSDKPAIGPQDLAKILNAGRIK
jgi:hypothetical protein